MKRTRANWTHAILVCGKCSRKVGGGFGDKGRTPFAKMLRRTMRAGKGRKAPVGVVETKCLGICPKRAVTVIDSRAPGAWLLVPPGTPIAEVATALELPAAE